jgi:hypothetical protein
MLFDKHVNDRIGKLTSKEILEALRSSFEQDGFVKIKAGDLEKQ